MLSSQSKDNRKVIILVIVITFLSVFTGCRFSGNSGLSPSKKSDSAADQTAYLELASEYFVEGIGALRIADTVNALKFFETAYMLDTGSNFLYDKVIEISIASNNPGSAIRAIMRGREYSQIEDEELRKLSTIFSRYNYFDEAFDVISAIKEKTKKDTLVLAGVAERVEKYLYAAQLYKTQFSDTSAELQIRIADLYRRAGHFATAESILTLVDQKHPNDIWVKRGLLFSFIGQNNVNSAKKTLEEILIIDSLNIDMWFLMGSLSEETQDFETAAKSYKKAIEIDGDFVGAVWALIVLSTKTGDIETLDAFAEKLPDDSFFRLQELMLFSIKNGDLETTGIFAKKLSERHPEVAQYWAVLGKIYNAKTHYDSALTALNKAFELGIKDPIILFELGMASERSGKFEDAEKYFKEALEINPKDAITANYLGYMWAETGINLKEAEELLISALQEEPDNGAYLDSYGWILFKQERYEEAEKPLLRSLEFITDDYVVYYHLGELYLKLGNEKDALNYFIKANSFENNPDFETIEQRIKDLSK